MRDNQEQETILCELFNNTDEPWSFSELDLKLEAGWLGQESEGYSPFWLNDDPTNVPRIEIPARTRSTVRINWNDWAAQGVWDPMAGPQAVSKPALPERQPGKIWVRISGPGFGTIPVSLTHPDQLSQGTAATLPDGSVVELLGIQRLHRHSA